MNKQTSHRSARPHTAHSRLVMVWVTGVRTFLILVRYFIACSLKLSSHECEL